MPVLMTEEGLEKVVRGYVANGTYETMDEARSELRYSVADAPGFDDLEGSTPTVDALVEPYAESLDDASGYALLAKAAIEALKELEKQRTFAGVDRKRFLLAIVTEDTPKDWSRESARKLNPPEVFKRFDKATRVAATYADCDAFAIDPTGKTIYSAGTEDLRKRVSSLIAYDIVGGRRLVQRWVYNFGRSGTSLRAVSYAADTRDIIAAGTRAEYAGLRATLLRFPEGVKRPLRSEEFEVDRGLSGIAVSADGSRIAMGRFDGKVDVADESFRLLRTHKFVSEVGTPLYLNRGEFLVPTEKGIFRLVKTGAEVSRPAATRIPARHLAVDAKQSLLAVGQWFTTVRPFGIQLLRLPSLKPLRTIKIHGLQLVRPALSSDGKLLAFEARDFNSSRGFTCVVDTATGKEIARRKSNLANDLKFLPDVPVVVIADAPGTKGRSAPLVLWDLTSAVEAAGLSVRRHTARPKKARA